MPLKNMKPTTPGRRQMSTQDVSMLTSRRPLRSLLQRLPRTGGRNNYGRITTRHRGGGHRRLYRFIDFKRDKDGIPAKVAAIEYDPNRTARIALLHYADGEKRYILWPDGLKVGQSLMSGPQAEPKAGNCLPLDHIPLGSAIHNIELLPGQGAKLVRSAGGLARLTAREGGYAHITLPSGEVRKVPDTCRATLGQVGNLDHQHVVLSKAGRNRYRGWRPEVRGIAMNPVDHPMGGGAGKAKGHQPQSPTGVLAKGGKTRKPKARTNALIVRRKPKKGH